MGANAVATLDVKRSPLAAMADRLSFDPNDLQSVIMKTVMPSENVTNEQFIAFCAVANAYKLDPLKKEIYAFPGRNNAIQPIVSIDGWLSIINSHPEFDGMETEDIRDANGNLEAVTCRIYRKDRAHPTVVTEWLSECEQNTDQWKKRPGRMLRHKAVIQCGRYAFGLGGIMEEDEAREIEINPQATDPVVDRAVKPAYPADSFAQNLPKWRKSVEAAAKGVKGAKNPDELIAMVETRGTLTDEQKDQIRALAPLEVDTETGEVINENA